MKQLVTPLRKERQNVQFESMNAQQRTKTKNHEWVLTQKTKLCSNLCENICCGIVGF